MLLLNLYEKIKELASRKGVSIRQIEEHFGYGNGTIRRWGTQNPSIDKVRNIANYFNVSVDYLLGVGESNILPILSLNEILDSIELYSGGELTDNDREMLKVIIETRKKDK